MALEMFLSWQALVLAVITVTVSGGVKRIVAVAKPDWRKNRILARLVVPAIPLVLGTLAGMFIPLRPEAVIEYVNTHADDGWQWAAYGGYGFVTGGVAGAWLYDRFADFFGHGKDDKEKKDDGKK